MRPFHQILFIGLMMVFTFSSRQAHKGNLVSPSLAKQYLLQNRLATGRFHSNWKLARGGDVKDYFLVL